MKPLFIQQHDQTDCGVACLLMVIRTYGGDASLETLRQHSGTSLQGTSLLGLQQAAAHYHLSAEAFEVDDLTAFRQEATFPCILHVVINQQLEHYVICYKVEGTTYHIIDPAHGYTTWSETELLDQWQSRAVLCLQPLALFEKVEQNRFKRLEWFKNLIKADAPLLGIAVALGILLAILGMTTAIFSQKLIDEILPKRQLTKLWSGLGLLVVLLVARGLINYLRSFLLFRQSKDFNNRLMTDFYEKLLQLPKTFFDGRSTGEIMARLNDTRRIQSVIHFLVGNVVIDLLVFMISVGFVFTYSWQIGLLSLLSIPLYGWLVITYNQRIIEAQKLVMKNYAATESHFVDAISGIATIKVANKESFFLAIGKTVYSFFQEKIYQLNSLGNRYGLWNEVFNAFLVVGILGYASWLTLEKSFQLGEMMAVFSISVGMIGAVARLATTNLQLQEAQVAFDRMYEFAAVQQENKIKDKSIKLGGVNSISVRNLSFRFAGKSLLINDLSFEIKKGKLTVLVGEVGTGKSILLQILQKFRLYESGLIQINDTIDFNDISPNEWREQLGVVSQEIKLFSGTLLDNIVLGNTQQEAEEAIRFCREVGFSAYFEKLPQGYFTIVGEEGINLSGGQKQLVALARALYKKPTILLLDEPTSAMDATTEAFVLHLLQEIKTTITIMMVTYRTQTLSFADTVYEVKGNSSDKNSLLSKRTTMNDKNSFHN